MDRGIFVGNIYILIFFNEGHSDSEDFSVQIIDVTDTRNPTVREFFWISKLNC